MYQLVSAEVEEDRRRRRKSFRDLSAGAAATEGRREEVK